MTTPTSADTPAGTLPAELIETVLAAAAAAAARLPASEGLTVGEPSTDLSDAGVLPADASSAVVARLSGAVRGEAAIIVAADLVAALAESPLGALDLVPAVQPALEDAAATLGQVVVEPGRELAPDLALDGLRGSGTVVIVPLLAEGQVRATFAIALTGGGAARPGAGGGGGSVRRAGLDLLRDVEMEVTAELGRTRMTVRELLSLAPGAVIELDRAAGSPADVLVNGTLLARGEVVVVDEDFGIRITEIVVGNGDDGRGDGAASEGSPA